ncbi:MAG: acyl-CoA thioesterase [Bacteroidia bacterium]
MNFFFHECKLRVRYSETDQMKYVYYGNYAGYFEVARVEAMRNFGFNYKELEDSGIFMPVSKYQIDFIKPCLYDEELTIRTEIHEIPAARIRFQYSTLKENGELANRAFTELFFFDKETSRPVRAPEKLVNLLKSKIF